MPLGFSETELLARFPYEDTTDPTFVDVGAHVGSSSRPFAERGWRVIAFEPEPENRRELERNFREFAGFHCVPKAVTDVAGQTVPFYVSEEHWGIHSLKPFHATHRPAFLVETVRLDGELDELRVNEVTVLKIDIEGADYLALRSFDFSRFRPQMVMCEFMDERSEKHFGYTHHDMAKYLQDREYAVFVSEWAPIVEYARKDRPSQHPHRFLRCARYPLDHAPAWGNLIGVLPERVKEFEQVLTAYLAEICFLESPSRWAGRGTVVSRVLGRLLKWLVRERQ